MVSLLGRLCVLGVLFLLKAKDDSFVFRFSFGDFATSIGMVGRAVVGTFVRRVTWFEEKLMSPSCVLSKKNQMSFSFGKRSYLGRPLRALGEYHQPRYFVISSEHQSKT